MKHNQDISRLRNRSTAFRIGLILALALVWMAFNWTSDRKFETQILSDGPPVIIEDDVPVTYQKDPPPPKPPVLKPPTVIEPVFEELPVLKKAPEPIILENELTVPINTKVVKKEKPDHPPVKIEFEEEPEDDVVIPFVNVQQKPRFPENACDKLKEEKAIEKCTEKAMLDYIYSKIRYPVIARENGIEGRTVISFIVDKNGKITDAKILRDPGGGIGKEALRVVNSMPDWLPGRQRHKAVKVQFNLPVVFKLDPN